jgi:hypothetical protein
LRGGCDGGLTAGNGGLAAGKGGLAARKSGGRFCYSGAVRRVGSIVHGCGAGAGRAGGGTAAAGARALGQADHLERAPAAESVLFNTASGNASFNSDLQASERLRLTRREAAKPPTRRNPSHALPPGRSNRTPRRLSRSYRSQPAVPASNPPLPAVNPKSHPPLKARSSHDPPLKARSSKTASQSPLSTRSRTRSHSRSYPQPTRSHPQSTRCLSADHLSTAVVPSWSQWLNHWRSRPSRSTRSHGSPVRDRSWVERG